MSEKSMKSFRASEEALKKLEELITKSGKKNNEFFEDLISELAIKDIANEKNEVISADLRKHFESDVSKLKTATNSIITTFISQMENISVEKNRWEKVKESELNIKQIEIDNKIFELNKALQDHATSDENYKKLLVDYKTLEKDRDTLLQRVHDLELLNGQNQKAMLNDETKINSLNEMVVEKDQKLKELEPFEETNKQLLTDLADTKKELQKLKEEHNEEILKQKDTLIFDSNQRIFERERELDIEKNKALDLLREKLNKEINSYQEKYEKLLDSKDKLMSQNYELRNSYDRVEEQSKTKDQQIEKLEELNRMKEEQIEKISAELSRLKDKRDV